MRRNYILLRIGKNATLKNERFFENDDSSNFTKTKWFFSALVLFCMLFTGLKTNAQVNVTGTANTTPAMSASYATLALAIADVNNRTAISGPVTLTLASAQTAPAGGYSLTNVAITGGSNTNRFIFDGAGFTVTAGVGVSTTTDAFFKIIGADFISLQNFVMSESVANVTQTTQIEWGVAVLYATATNGSQNITIQGNTITLNRTNFNTFGIYSNSTHTVGAPTTSATASTVTGGNHNLKVYSNTISNVNMGVVVVGPTAVADANTGTEIGGAGLGNTITNFGTSGTFSAYANVSATVNGILVRNSNGFVLSNNTITSSNGGVTSGTLNGIQVPAASNAPTATFTNSINSNIISLRSAVATGAINGINVPSGSASATSTLNINSNDFNTFGHTVAASGVITFITNGSTHQIVTMNSNTFTNIAINTTGNVTFFSYAPSLTATAVFNINSNSIVTAFNKTGAGGTVTIWSSNSSSVVGSVQTFNNNNFSNITLTGATTFAGYTNTDGPLAGGPTKTVTGNTMSSIIGGTGSITGITVGFSTSANVSSNIISNINSGGAITAMTITSVNQNASQNTIIDLSSSGASAVTGIAVSAGTTNNIFKNTISNLSGSNASSTVNGILVSAGTTISLFNNRIGDLRATTANASNPVVGINITGGATVNAYYNTVNLATTSSGAVFGSSAISVSTTPTVTLNNNNFVNTSTANGAGLTVAYRRSTSTLTTHGATSNRNNYNASTVYTDGATPQATIGAFKTLVGPTRDANSIGVSPSFLSTLSGNVNFLKLNPAIASQLESGAANISGITDDFENTIRQGNPGYLAQVNGGGTAPDMGADEYDGIPAPVCVGTPAASTINGAASVCTGTGATLSLSLLYTDLGITYQWTSGTTLGGPYPNTLGTTATQATGNLTTTTYYVCTITCTNSGLSFVTAEKSVIVNPLPTVVVTPNTGSICTPGGSAVTLVASGATTYTWLPVAGLSATTGATVSANPTATTTYTVTGTDANGCVNTATAVITVSAKPDAVTISPTTPTICSGAIQILTAAGGGSAGTSATIGSGTGFTTAGADGPTAFNNRRLNYTAQSIYTAAELNAAGITAGNITSLAYNISSNGDATTNANFTVKMGHVGATVNFPSSSFFDNTAYTSVYGPATYTHAAPGFQIITFSTPFVWNGIDNICIDVRHDGIDSINNAATQFTTTAGNATLNTFNNAAPVTGTLTTTRLNIRLGFSNPATSIVWAPTTGLFTDAGATTAYTGSPSTTVVYAQLGATQAYTATSTNAAGCQTVGNVTVTVSAGAAITTDPTATAKCAGETAIFNVVATGATLTYQWRKGGSPLLNGGTISGADTATLTITNVTAADAATYDVIVSSSCGSPVTSLGAVLTVNPLPATTTASGAGTYCTSTTITANNGGDGTMYFQGTTSGGTSTATASASQVVSASGTYYFRAQSAAGCWGPQGSVAVVIETPPGITGTDASICQGASGTIAAVAANSCISYVNSGTTLSGTFTAGDPQAKRPTTSIVNTATCSFDASILRGYQTQQFQVSVTGTYTFDMTSTDDGMAYITTGAFTPGSCATGTWVRGDDDTGPGNDPQLLMTLTAGTVYTLYSTTYSTTAGNSTAAYSWTITPPIGGQLMLPVAGAIQWYTAASGGSSIGSGSPFNPVGVAGSGLADTNTAGTTTYYAACSSSSSCRTAVNFVINPNVTPTFTAVAAICAGGSLSALPTTSNNGITGTWLPALDNTATTTYTFTPTAGQCATTTTLTITVNPNVTPTFTAVAPICYGGSLTALPTTSNNGITGTWSPALNNTVTTTYTFTPTVELCATTTTLPITVYPNLTATYSVTNVSCNGGSNGSIVVTPSGGSGVYQTVIFSGVGVGVNLNSINQLPPSVNSPCSPNECAQCLANFGGACIQQTFAGILGPCYCIYPTGFYSGPFEMHNENDDIRAGSYVAVTFDSNGCWFVSPPLTVTEPAPLVATSTTGTISCNGGTTTVNVAATGGTAPYTGTGVFTVSAGAYSYTVTDANGCTTIASGSVSQPTPLVASSTAGPVSCSGGTSTVTVTATGGTAPYTGTGVFTVSEGPYSYTVTDANGCTAITSITIVTNPNVTYYTDADGDGYGNISFPIISCTGAPLNTVANSTDCNDANAAIHPGAIDVCLDGIDNDCNGNIDNVGLPGGCVPVLTTLPVATCGSTINNLAVTITATYVVGAQGYRFRVKNLNTNAIQIVDRPVNSFALSNLPGITLGTPYQIDVALKFANVWQPFYGAACTVNTPSPLCNIGAQCGTTLTSMTQFVYCTYVPSITGYRFRITKLSDSSVQIFDSGLNRFFFNQLPNRSFNSIYSVEVALKNTDGTYLPYNTGCNISTPNFPTSEVRLSQCDYTALSNTESIVATLVSGATEYRFLIYNVSLGYSFSIDRPVNTFNLNMFTGLTPGTTYSVQVAVKIGGIFGPYGKICNLTTPGGARNVTDVKLSNDFNAIAYPNPFAEGFKLEVKTSAESTIQIRVYDMLGKLVENRNVESSEINNQEVGTNYPSGVYNVIVSQGENTQTLRVIKR
jgi:hypothetical protein